MGIFDPKKTADAELSGAGGARLERMVRPKHASALEPLESIVEANQWPTKYTKKGLA
jgi:hypothetical protein